LTVQTAAVREEKLTASPDDAVAPTPNGAAPSGLLASAAKVMVWAALATVKLWLTFGAARYCAFPDCAAWIVHVPAAMSVTMLPLTAHTAVVVDENVTARPEDVVALTANGGSP